MQNHEQKSGRKSLNPQEKKDKNKSDKKAKEKFTKIQKTNIPISVERSSGKKNIPKKKTEMKLNQKSEHKKDQKSFDVKNIKLNFNINNKQEPEKIEPENKKEEELQIEGENKYEFNIYKNLKQNFQNMEKSCKDGISKESFYCLECKLSCCPKCPLFHIHNSHELVKKYPYYKLENNFIDESFKDIDSIFSLNPNYLTINKVKGELKMNVTNMITQLINQLNKIKEEKLKEIDNIFIGTENCVEKLKENEKIFKNNLYKFFEKFKNFVFIDINDNLDAEKVNPEANEIIKNLEGNSANPEGMIQPNKDMANSAFLISYDILKHTEFMNNLIKNIFIDIKFNLEKFNEDFNMKAKEVEKSINQLLTPFEGMLKYQYLQCDFYSQINAKLLKYDAKIDNVRNTLFEKVNKKGSFEDIERENRIAVTEISTKFEYILNNQLIDQDEATTIKSLMTKGKKNRKYGSGASKAASIITSSKFKNGNYDTINSKYENLNFPKIYETPDEIKLNKNILQEYFMYAMINFVKKEKKKKKDNLEQFEEEFDGDIDKVKPIPGTNEMQCYDKKSRGIIKKIVKFDRKTHKYNYFLNGCRTLLIKDKLYIIGGVDKENQITKMAYTYYIKTNELKMMPEMIKPHAYHSVEFLDFYKSILVIGGENISTCELYDMNTGFWRELPEMKIPRAHCGIYLDKMNHAIYSFFGIIGNITEKNNYTDVLECLELRKIALGWYKIDYNNKAEMNFKSGFNKILPLTPEMVLIYGATNMRDFAKKSAVYLIQKQEMIKIDNKIFNEIREASKKYKKLNKVLASYI